jgi:RP/EB family microtubule-associated protein
MSTIGMMDGAFFVGRKEIMDWVNSTLDINLSKVEDTANGAVACQLLDIMYPGQVPLHKVNWAAKQDFEFVANYKILQNSFTKLNIERHIDVDRLISGRYMDNLEFMQWFKRFFEMSVSDKKDYDAVGQRSKGKGWILIALFCVFLIDLILGGAQFGGGKRASNLKPSSAPSKATSVTKVVAPVHKAPTIAAKTTETTHHPPSKAAPPHTTSSVHSTVATHKVSADSGASAAEIAQLRAANEESQRAFQELKQEMEGLEKERDFYFEKLRDVEVLLQEIEDRGEGNDTTAAVMKILYATADGFEQVVESGEEQDAADPESDLPDGAQDDDTY